jgi:hypothetical protein
VLRVRATPSSSPRPPLGSNAYQRCHECRVRIAQEYTVLKQVTLASCECCSSTERWGLRTQPQCSAATYDIVDRGRGSREVFLVTLHDVCLIHFGSWAAVLTARPSPPQTTTDFLQAQITSTDERDPRHKMQCTDSAYLVRSTHCLTPRCPSSAKSGRPGCTPCVRKHDPSEDVHWGRTTSGR